jgi:hypothetical protein
MAKKVAWPGRKSYQVLIRLKLNFLKEGMGSIALRRKNVSMVLQVGETIVLQRVELEEKVSSLHF